MFGVVDLVTIAALIAAWLVVRRVLKITAKVIFVVACFIAGIISGIK